MKANCTLYVALMLLLSVSAFSQIQLNSVETKSTSDELAKISESVVEYNLFTLDLFALNEYVKSNKSGAKVNLILTKDLSWEFTLEENDIRFGDFSSMLVNKEGVIHSIPIGECNTYSGYVNNDKDQYVRFFISDEMFKGMIVDKEKGTYMVESLSTFIKSGSDNRLILYKLSDAKINKDFCGIIDKNNILKSTQSTTNTELSFTNCRILEIITEADGEYYINHGSNVTNTLNDMLAIANIVDGVYNNAFNTRIVVVKQFLHENPASDPYSSTDGVGSGVVDEFKNYWNANRPFESRDMAILFTGKNLGTGLGGAVPTTAIGAICRNLNDSYAFVIDIPLTTYVMAHELGHLFNATHTSGSDCSPNQSVMCTGVAPVANIFFANVSQTQVNNHLNAGDACLRFFSSVGILGPYEICASSTATYEATGGPVNSGNNWTWTSSSNINLISNTGKIITATGNSSTGVGWVEATQNIGCPLTKRFYIKLGKPEVDIWVNGSNIYDDFCASELVNIEVVSIFPEIDPGTWSYNWSITSGNTAGNLNWGGRWASYYNDHYYECTGFNIDVSNSCGTIQAATSICTKSCYPYYKVYPNPAKDYLFVEFENTNNVNILPDQIVLYREETVVPVKSISVREAYARNEIESNKIKIDVSGFPHGIYYLHIIFGNDKEQKTDKIRILIE